MSNRIYRSRRALNTVSKALVFSVLGCATTREHAARRDFEQYPNGRQSQPQPESPRRDLNRGLPAYVAYALEQSPELRASYERWRASTLRISAARRLPEPVVGFGYFIRSVETRVGPQIARVSLQQSFPWPGQLSDAADSASAQASAQQRRFEAEALALSARVSNAYWTLWNLRRTRKIHSQHLDVLLGLSETVRARVTTGSATLAELQQVDLAAARLEDRLAAMRESEQVTAATLRAAIGAPPGLELPTTGEPPETLLPAVDETWLRNAAAQHPLVTSHALLAEANQSAADSEAARAYPSFTLGADWIITGEAAMPNVPDSGKDAVVVAASMKVPLWQSSYADSSAAARAEADAQRSEARAATYRAWAELDASLSAVRDAARRVALFRDTLVPQAQSTYESVLGAYATGRASVAATLLAQRDLLELRIEQENARTDYAQSWARLESVVGRPVPTQSAATPRDPLSNPERSP